MYRALKTTALLLLLGLFSAGGCGQKGPLYMEPEQPRPAPDEQPAEEDNEDDGD